MSIWHALRERLALLRRDQRDLELDEEIRFHLDVETNRLEAAGLSRGDARLQAMERFGNPIDVALASRDAWHSAPPREACLAVCWQAR